MQPIQDKMATGIGMGPGPQVGFTRILCIGMSVDKRVKLSVYIPWGHVGGVKKWLHLFLTLALYVGKWKSPVT